MRYNRNLQPFRRNAIAILLSVIALYPAGAMQTETPVYFMCSVADYKNDRDGNTTGGVVYRSSTFISTFPDSMKKVDAVGLQESSLSKAFHDWVAKSVQLGGETDSYCADAPATASGREDLKAKARNSEAAGVKYRVVLTGWAPPNRHDIR